MDVLQSTQDFDLIVKILKSKLFKEINHLASVIAKDCIITIAKSS